MKKKLYLVKREVWATNVEHALVTKGVVYEVVLAEDRLQPENQPKPIKGFENKV